MNNVVDVFDAFFVHFNAYFMCSISPVVQKHTFGDVRT